MTPAFFEGPEKKVELAVVDEFASLRSFGEDRWRRVVHAAGAEVISRRAHADFDAYLLSESSLFVYDSFVTMITCGQTRLVAAVEAMLEFIGADSVAVLFYERKNEHFPEQQPSSFYDDARQLRQWLPGAAVRLGLEHEHAVWVFHTTRPYEPEPDDTTIEVLMHGIDERRAEAFRRASSDGADGRGTAVLVADRLGLSDILPGFTIDEHLFEPTGYSLNAVRDNLYFTVHVTPQRLGSYVSFETNFDFRADPGGLVAQVVERFRPESFDVVAFVPQGDPLSVQIPGYRLRKHVQEPLSGYQVTFQHFYRPGSQPTRAMPVALD